MSVTVTVPGGSGAVTVTQSFPGAADRTLANLTDIQAARENLYIPGVSVKASNTLTSAFSRANALGVPVDSDKTFALTAGVTVAAAQFRWAGGVIDPAGFTLDLSAGPVPSIPRGVQAFTTNGSVIFPIDTDIDPAWFGIGGNNPSIDLLILNAAAASAKASKAHLNIGCPLAGPYLIDTSANGISLTGLTHSLRVKGVAGKVVIKRKDACVTADGGGQSIISYGNQAGMKPLITFDDFETDGNATGNPYPMVLTGVTGTFLAGDTVTGSTSHITAKVISASGNTVKIDNFFHDFLAGETITSSSGGSGRMAMLTLSSVVGSAVVAGNTFTCGTSGVTGTVLTVNGLKLTATMSDVTTLSETLTFNTGTTATLSVGLNAGDWQHVHNILGTPSGLRSLSVLLKGTTKAWNAIGDGISFAGNTTNTWDDIDTPDYFSPGRTRFRNDFTFGGGFYIWRPGNCRFQRLDIELNGISTDKANVAYNVVGGEITCTQFCSLNLKNGYTKGRRDSTFQLAALKVAGLFNPAGFNFKIGTISASLDSVLNPIFCDFQVDQGAIHFTENVVANSATVAGLIQINGNNEIFGIDIGKVKLTADAAITASNAGFWIQSSNAVYGTSQIILGSAPSPAVAVGQTFVGGTSAVTGTVTNVDSTGKIIDALVSASVTNTETLTFSGTGTATVTSHVDTPIKHKFRGVDFGAQLPAFGYKSGIYLLEDCDFRYAGVATQAIATPNGVGIPNELILDGNRLHDAAAILCKPSTSGSANQQTIRIRGGWEKSPGAFMDSSIATANIAAPFGTGSGSAKVVIGELPTRAVPSIPTSGYVVLNQRFLNQARASAPDYWYCSTAGMLGSGGALTAV